MKVAKQLFREFSLPFSVALAWTVYSSWGKSFELVSAVSIFGPAFFLASWLVGQIFRVRKQAGVERSLGDVESRLINLTTSLGGVEGRLENISTGLEKNVQELVGHINGGDSFCCVMPNGVKDGKRQWLVRQCGVYPLFNLRMRIVDIEDLTKQIEETFVWDEFSVGGTAIVNSIPRASGDRQEINVFFHSRNGRVAQEIRFDSVAGQQVYAYRLSRDYETLIQYLPDGFALREEDKRDWLPDVGVSGSQKEWAIEYAFQRIREGAGQSDALGE
ncbi:hypothetical protein ACK3BK_17030 [Pseudomonas sp. L7]|uniref:hypothetical protein n=1 Tax=Pseudomonas sp. L7 TaxID=3388343 RepID=UPI0039853239